MQLLEVNYVGLGCKLPRGYYILVRNCQKKNKYNFVFQIVFVYGTLITAFTERVINRLAVGYIKIGDNLDKAILHSYEGNWNYGNYN